eukprot:m.242805 g.242805  ORF g.242805 m.242805 type:complete len:566 (-) comp14103_c0_seq1:131-1828(-)
MKMADTSNLPIDIHSSKLTDWLLSRKKIQPNYAEAAAAIRPKITAALADMPDTPEITALLAGSYINYFHCKRILEILKVTDASTKTLFGGYSSRRIKDWQDIVKLYSTENCYLGESSTILQHDVSYEIPALKRAIQRAQARVQEIDHREHDLLKSAADYQHRFAHICKELTIEGVDIPKELASLAAQLPAIFERVTGLVRTADIEHALDLYAVFIKFTIGKSEEVCPLLKYVRVKGNTSVHEWKTGTAPPPLSAAEKSSGANASSGSAAADGIDWGADGQPEIDWCDGGAAGGVVAISSSGDAIDWGDGAASAEPATIDFGDDEAGKVVEIKEAGGIDWGDDAAAGVATDVVIEGAGGIDWGDDAAPAAAAPAGVTIDWSDDASPAGPAAPADAAARAPLLQSPELRNQLIDELLELECFLSGRRAEMKAAHDMATTLVLQNAPPSVATQTAESIDKMVVAVKAALEPLLSSRTRYLVMLEASPKYAQRLAQSLQEKRSMGARIAGKVDDLKVQRTKVLEESASANTRLATTIAATRALQREIEKELSAMYSGRPVNLIGDINAI